MFFSQNSEDWVIQNECCFLPSKNGFTTSLFKLQTFYFSRVKYEVQLITGVNTSSDIKHCEYLHVS